MPSVGAGMVMLIRKRRHRGSHLLLLISEGKEKKKQTSGKCLKQGLKESGVQKDFLINFPIIPIA